MQWFCPTIRHLRAEESCFLFCLLSKSTDFLTLRYRELIEQFFQKRIYGDMKMWLIIAVMHTTLRVRESNLQISLFPWVSLDHSITVGCAELISRLCFKCLLQTFNLGISWHSPCRELSWLGEPKCLHDKKLSRLPGFHNLSLPRDGFAIVM